MSLQDWAALAEIVGAIGVIASLIYVGRQLQQTNAMSRSEIRREFSSQANAWASSIASSPDLSAAMAKVHYHELVREDATDSERIHVAYTFVGIIGQIHMAYEQMKEGFLSVEEVEEYLSSRVALLQSPYLRSVWPYLAPGWPADFQRWFVERQKLGGVDLETPQELEARNTANSTSGTPSNTSVQRSQENAE